MNFLMHTVRLLSGKVHVVENLNVVSGQKDVSTRIDFLYNDIFIFIPNDKLSIPHLFAEE